MALTPTRNAAEALDSQDPLAHKRDEFFIEEGTIYLDGNSLGPAPKAVFDSIDRTMREEWAKGLIRSHNTAGWFMLTDTLGDRLAQMLGAGEGEIVVCDTTSLNIYKTLHAALSMQPGRRKIVAEGTSFPTNLYMAEGVRSTLDGATLALEGRDGDRIEDMIDANTAVVMLNHVDYRSGVIRDVKALTKLAHERGALVMVDMCHSAGVIPVDLHDLNVDFAVGCTYKYLNGGPGSPAYAYAAKRHHGKFTQPLSGWHGHAAPFKFEQSYRQGEGARALLCGTQHTLSMRALQSGLAVFDDVNITDLYSKGRALSDLFVQLVESFADDFGIGFYSPKDGTLRNGQVSLTHAEGGYAIVQALIARGVIGDFRQPNVMRFGFTPLYLRFADVWDAANHLYEVMRTEEWKEDRFNVVNTVT
ncbi:kynureninase [Phaeobacter gallaeciensis]|uniref:Kynureninase n=1 Tax=Phaeobacter gallaeciensis TaxID=60890 RepID=A0AAC9ZDA8_9RHOB|nr:kynureninase [Phaeobacter gallaeciensis]AHD11834.1 Kynureninase [Phaeobacter gallaeciensis DSM 26640]ATE95098.1 Kynureninase [Phaeobacter gallaeciensis]ATE99406.1 Kynureninase [Phaeobacter gallaeciensis]ATF03802.1 Kynureninase [Phaeobacter gallaeciensis]ATF07995.1 Kynureninase [Phaeobacter gallaeciensis]